MNNSIIDIELTNRLGYDGGAFFNQDASEIVWRVYHPQSQEDVINYQSLLEQSSIRPMALQIWTMQAESSNKKKVADNDSENFGPYFFPNGKRIIFSSNLHDPKGRDFDLYAINTNGKDLERIIYFDGFPMFSPDGKDLVFASNRNQTKRGETNLFITEWKKL